VRLIAAAAHSSATLPEPRHFPIFGSLNAQAWEGPAESVRDWVGNIPALPATTAPDTPEHEAYINKLNSIRSAISINLRLRKGGTGEGAADIKISCTRLELPAQTFDLILYLDTDNYGYAVPLSKNRDIPFGSVLLTAADMTICNGVPLNDETRLIAALSPSLPELSRLASAGGARGVDTLLPRPVDQTMGGSGATHKPVSSDFERLISEKARLATLPLIATKSEEELVEVALATMREPSDLSIFLGGFTKIDANWGDENWGKAFGLTAIKDLTATSAAISNARMQAIYLPYTKMCHCREERRGKGSEIVYRFFTREGLADGPNNGKAFNFIAMVDQDNYGYIVPAALDPLVPVYQILYSNPVEGGSILNVGHLSEPTVIKKLFAVVEKERDKRARLLARIQAEEGRRAMVAPAAATSSTNATEAVIPQPRTNLNRQARRAAERKTAKDKKKK